MDNHLSGCTTDEPGRDANSTVEMVCLACKEVVPRDGRRSNFCFPCFVAHNAEASKAGSAVHSAVRRGILPPVKSCTCVDCGKPATEYDHRDYTRPIDVVPCCRSCNKKRGKAFNSFFRPALSS
jgi:hypothetical protein